MSMRINSLSCVCVCICVCVVIYVNNSAHIWQEPSRKSPFSSGNMQKISDEVILSHSIRWKGPYSVRVGHSAVIMVSRPLISMVVLSQGRRRGRKSGGGRSIFMMSSWRMVLPCRLPYQGSSKSTSKHNSRRCHPRLSFCAVSRKYGTISSIIFSLTLCSAMNIEGFYNHPSCTLHTR